MKQSLICICCLFFLTNCYWKPTKFPEQTKLADGYYNSSTYWHLAYVKISNDTAFADFFRMYNYPSQFYSDTLLFDASSQSWKSNKGSITQNGAYYTITSKYFCAACPEPKMVYINQQIKKDKTLTQSTIETSKNYAYLNMKTHEHVISRQPAKVHPKYYKLNEKVDFITDINKFLDSIQLMPHKQFAIAYKKYEEELEKRSKEFHP